MAERDNELGGAAGGLLNACKSVGTSVLKILIGARYTARQSLGKRAVAGGIVIGLSIGAVVGVVADGVAGGGLGCFLGMIAGGFMAAGLLLLISD